MTTTPPTRSQNERADQSRARILEAAIRKFSENGLAGARTEQIAEAAGVNKALIYYYFQSKEKLYSAALESVAEGVRATSMAVLEGSSSAGERFLLSALNHFDRIHTNPGFQRLMQQEMIRLHRGEDNALTPLVERFFKPLTERMQQVIEEGIATGELIPADPLQIHYAALGANVFYFLSAPLMKMIQGTDPLEKSALEFRRASAIQYLGQSLFIDREQGARVAARVLAASPMPKSSGFLPQPAPEFRPIEDQEVRRK
jgi:TetR/AcrR family transcriptional regulator